MSALAGRIAVVTGASAGIGRAIASRLAQGGARVVVNARREEKLRELVSEIGEDQAVAAPGDSSEESVIAAMHDLARERFGGEAKLDGYGYVSVLDADGDFRATQSDLALNDNKLSLPGSVVNLLRVAPGDQMGYTPMPKPATPKRRKRDRDAQASAG